MGGPSGKDLTQKLVLPRGVPMYYQSLSEPQTIGGVRWETGGDKLGGKKGRRRQSILFDQYRGNLILAKIEYSDFRNLLVKEEFVYLANVTPVLT